MPLEKCSTRYPGDLGGHRRRQRLYRRNCGSGGESRATVVREPIRGYGQACLRAQRTSATDIVVFLDGDYSDFPEEMPTLYEPIATGAADLVIGSRVLGQREKGPYCHRRALVIGFQRASYAGCSAFPLPI